jgi:cytochrome c oxidase subunit 2
MVGWVIVMDPADYQRWLAGGTEGSLASQGERLFQKYACNTCHTGDTTGRGPVLNGVYGTDVMLSTNQIVKADDNYIRESILNPQAKIVKGFQPIMPTFQGQVSEDDLIKLLAYVKSLTPAKPTNPEPKAPEAFQTNAGAPTNPGATTQTTTGAQPKP